MFLIKKPIAPTSINTVPINFTNGEFAFSAILVALRDHLISGSVLFFHEMNLDPKNPQWDERDFWHFSIGHVTPIIYSLMGERGYFPLKDLMKFRQFDGHLQGHPSRHDTPGIEVSAGSLGQGLSVCIGAALASRLDKNPRRVYCVMGDGEQQEGQVWEAVMCAAHYRLDNVCAIIDYNRKQIDGDVEDIMGIAPLADKYRAFNWNVIEVDGHDHAAIQTAFAAARAHKGRPSVLLAHTVMGQGISYMADDYRWHGKAPSKEEAEDFPDGFSRGHVTSPPGTRTPTGGCRQGS